MAKNCQACNDLQEKSSNFVLNGVTNAVCTSLKNNTGFNPSSGHKDCVDLEDANDCLIGNLENEINAYDVCDWKEFMRMFLGNIYNVIKAIICAICGLWIKVEDHDERIEDLCDLVNAAIAPPMLRYGRLMESEGTSNPQRVGGVIVTKGGSPLVQEGDAPVGSPTWVGTGVGLHYAKLKVRKCGANTCELHEWIAPFFTNVQFSNNMAKGDIFWYVTKAKWDEWGFSQHLWDIFTDSSWTYEGIPLGADRYARVNLAVDPDFQGGNVIRLKYISSSYPDDNNAPAGKSIRSATNSFRHYTHKVNC